MTLEIATLTEVHRGVGIGGGGGGLGISAGGLLLSTFAYIGEAVQSGAVTHVAVAAASEPAASPISLVAVLGLLAGITGIGLNAYARWSTIKDRSLSGQLAAERQAREVDRLARDAETARVERLYATAVRGQESQRVRIQMIEEDNRRLTGNLHATLKDLTDITRQNLDLSHDLMVAIGRFAPGATPPRPIADLGVRRPGRILVVEDHEVARKALAQLFTRYNFTVDAVGSVAEALARLLNPDCRPDVVVLDLMLPDGDGAAVLKAVKEAKFPIAVFVQSGVVEGERLAAIRELGPAGVFQKPLKFNDLLAEVVEACRSLT